MKFYCNKQNNKFRKIKMKTLEDMKAFMIKVECNVWNFQELLKEKAVQLMQIFIKNKKIKIKLNCRFK